MPLPGASPEASLPPRAPPAAPADAGDDFLDDLLSDEPAAAAPQAKLAAAGGTAQGMPRWPNPPADSHTGESRDADAAICKKPSTAAASVSPASSASWGGGQLERASGLAGVMPQICWML